MSQIAANHPAPDSTGLQDSDWNARLEKIAADPRMSEENTTISASSVRKFAGISIILGLIGLLITIVGGFSITWYQALAAFEVGVFSTLAISLGAMFWVMVFH